MKKLGNTIILLVMAAVVFYTGTGVTIMQYCCVNCETSYSILGQRHNCHPVSDISENTPEYTCPNCSSHVEEHVNDFSFDAKKGGCSSLRVSIDLDSHQNRPHISIPFVWLIDFEDIYVPVNKVENDILDLFVESNPPPFAIPRSYLSMIQVLII
jgi:DNA-directed RNA polymerase subunit RPC12/RpoP